MAEERILEGEIEIEESKIEDSPRFICSARQELTSVKDGFKSSQAMTIGFLNDFFQKNGTDSFERKQTERMVPELRFSSEMIEQTGRWSGQGEEKLVTEDDVLSEQNPKGKQNEDTYTNTALIQTTPPKKVQDHVKVETSLPIKSTSRYEQIFKVLEYIELVVSLLCMLTTLCVLCLPSKGFRIALITLLSAKLLAAFIFCQKVRHTY